EDAGRAVEAARKAGAIPAELDGAAATTWLSGVAARLAAADAYRPEPYEGDVVLVRATESHAVAGHDGALGWTRFVKGRVVIEWAPGSHLSVLGGEGARAVAAIVERHAARAGGQEAASGES
ncbi:MAG TPA: hypothetical protein VNI57_14090, partial [Candidatus Saccharimonadales bacterium]|nr:hypothetical protein [Candidatus Saccharimonadales bacterium]